MTDEDELRARIEARVAARRAAPRRPEPSASAPEAADAPALTPTRPWDKPSAPTDLPGPDDATPPVGGERSGLAPVRPWDAGSPSEPGEPGRPQPSNQEAVLHDLAEGGRGTRGSGRTNREEPAPWQRTESVDLDLKGAPTWDPTEYPPEAEQPGTGRRGRRPSRRLFGKRSDGADPVPTDEQESTDRQSPAGERPAEAPLEAPVPEPVATAGPAVYEPEPEPVEPEPVEPEPVEPEPVEPEPTEAPIVLTPPEPVAEPLPPIVLTPPEPVDEPVAEPVDEPEPRSAPVTAAPDPHVEPEAAPEPVSDETPDVQPPVRRPRPGAGTPSVPAEAPRRRPRPGPGSASTAAGPELETYRSATTRSRAYDPDLTRFLAATEPQDGDDEPEPRSRRAGRRSARKAAAAAPVEQPVPPRTPEPVAEPRPSAEPEQAEEPQRAEELKRAKEPKQPRTGPSRGARFGKALAARRRTFVRLVLVVVIALGAAFLLRQYVVEPYYVPSASMEPTLHGCPGCNDDHILVDKISYRLHDPKPNDIVVFDRPANAAALGITDKVLVKRVVAVGGDRVSLRNGLLYINNARLDEPYLNGDCGANATKPLSSVSNWTIPDGDIFVLGDNRCRSEDGRAFGPIKVSSVIGRAWLIIWPLSRFGTVG